QLLPLLGGDALRKWANCAEDALHDRDTRAIQHELPALMKAHDDLVLDAFAPVAKEPASTERHLNAPASVTSRDEALDARPCLDDRGLEGLDPVALPEDAVDARRDVPVRDAAEERSPGVASPQKEVIASGPPPPVGDACQSFTPTVVRT
ncbi:hypothetical protein ACQKGO_29375, partial [Corallococcus interemptor]